MVNRCIVLYLRINIIALYNHLIVLCYEESVVVRVTQSWVRL